MLINRLIRKKSKELHFNQVTILQCVVRVTLQGREVAHAVVDGHAGGEGNTCLTRNDIRL